MIRFSSMKTILAVLALCSAPLFAASNDFTAYFIDVEGGRARAVNAVAEDLGGLAPPASPPGKGFFGSITGTLEGTIELAK